jgi:hypothetical protein
MYQSLSAFSPIMGFSLQQRSSISSGVFIPDKKKGLFIGDVVRLEVVWDGGVIGVGF